MVKCCNKCKHYGIWTKSGQLKSDCCTYKESSFSFLGARHNCISNDYAYFEPKEKSNKKKRK